MNCRISVRVRGFCFFFLLGIFCLPVFSKEIFQTGINAKIQEVTFQNKWIDTKVSYNQEIVIKTMNLGGMAFLWPESNRSLDLSEKFNGSSTVLFDDHPLTGGVRIDTATGYTANELPVKNASETIIEIHPVNPEKLSVKKEFTFSALTSVIGVSTEILNSGTETIRFFPTEVFCQNTSQPYEHVSYLFVPIENNFHFIYGNNDLKNFEIIKNSAIFSAKYEKKLSEIALTSPEKWVVFYEGKNGAACSIEFDYHSEKIELVKDNRILFINGAGQMELDGKMIIRNENASPFMRTMIVLGKVTLKPGESFQYTEKRACSAAYGPIFQVKDGFLTNSSLKVFTKDKSFLLLGTYGIPMSAGIGFEFYDKQNRLIEKNYNVSMNLDRSTNPGHPSNAVPNFPSLLSHQIVFTTDLKNSIGEVTKVRVVLLDDKKKVIRVLDEADGPFKEYTGEIR